MTSALLEALSARGSEAYSKKLEQIQRDIVDAGVEKLKRKWSELTKKRFARLGRYTAGTVGLTVGLHFAFSPAALAGLFSATAASAFAEIENRLSEQGELRKEPMYFIWKIGR